ncbi:MAG: DNA topoisomerase IV subunit A [Candidatus Nanoarchaeia archaeon]|nr:DNA topoisomerase IV subunit A [Candidatus Haiyanarchaeum thermophilum]MCW1303139.1 DNA topoisomerase IV subunit A [Candidatus Haiyanarchaeum thermophilum]MCW1303804.1 DNA topoisomerase IV subunit A [Candidatus Haiyanarchaeum thermophilum]MCW1306580.1 DNA topoisomerase IV subunit A [Candidatus Haiyanarchaeum thermophilum]MCW1306993.1 DNA topoisomerase IV subunit A [Candidatus Haiyanarchaeum thermophilum]
MKGEVIKKLNELAEDVIRKAERGENPYILIPIRGITNVIYDEKNRRIILGDKVSKRYFLNVAHAKKFMQTFLVAAFCHQLLKEGIHASLRETFYSLKRTLPGSKENTFDTQDESDPIIVDLEVTLDLLREQLHLNADARGRLVGDVIIKDRGDTIDCSKLGSGGWFIPSNVEDIEFKNINAEFVLVVEKVGAFERLHEDKFWQKHKCILISTVGQPARGCRRLIQRLAYEFGLPIYVFVDADSYGFYIYSVIKYGSMSLAHISDRLGTHTAKFIGLTISDIDKYGLQNFTIKANELDIKRAQELLKYKWFQSPEWQKEIKLMIERKVKAELEALASKGLRYVSDVYLPTKIKNKEFLD